jgi:hypothetical protein
VRGNDIADFTVRRVGIVFDGLLGMQPPAAETGILSKLRRKHEPTVEDWEWDDIVYRSMRAFFTKGYDAAMEVYTFQGSEFAKALDEQMGQRSLWPTVVLSFANARALRSYLAANLDVVTVLTSTDDVAHDIGPRARVCTPGIPLGF